MNLTPTLLPHLELKRLLTEVGLFGDSYIYATGETQREIIATLVVVGRGFRLEGRQNVPEDTLAVLLDLSQAQSGLLLELLSQLLMKEGVNFSHEQAWREWMDEYGQAAAKLYLREQ